MLAVLEVRDLVWLLRVALISGPPGFKPAQVNKGWEDTGRPRLLERPICWHDKSAVLEVPLDVVGESVESLALHV
jgi:hypothetical protein